MVKVFENIEFKININGVDVMAKTNYLTIADMSLSLVKPEFKAYACSCHVPYFALPNHGNINSDGQLTEYGLQRANYVIKNLYECYILVMNKNKEINKALPLLIYYLDKAENKCQLGLNDLYALRKELRIQLRAGLLNGREFQMKVAPINKSIDELKFNLYIVKERLINRAVRNLFAEDKNCILRNYFNQLIDEQKQMNNEINN